MKIKFNIEYKTTFGEEVVLYLVDNGKEKRCCLQTLDGVHWSYELSGKVSNTSIIYHYGIEFDGKKTREEWTLIPHKLDVSAQKADVYTVFDRWNVMPEDSYLYSSAFTDCVDQKKLALMKPSFYAKTLRLIVRAPQLREGESLFVVGSDAIIGHWDIKKAIPMTQHSYNEWQVDLNAEWFGYNRVEFKFVVLNKDKADFSMWETGYNRSFELSEIQTGNVVVYAMDQAFFELWNRKLAGTLIPVFSLRSETSCGVGDFGDLKKMIDFVSQTGQRLLQVLPINDTTMTHTWTDSYPYSCISIFALHPQYVDLSSLPKLKDNVKQNKFNVLFKELNRLPQIDYERVNTAKIDYFHELFSQEGKKVMASEQYIKFFVNNEKWLVPYARYCSLRDEYGTADFSKWPAHNTWNEEDRAILSDVSSNEYQKVMFWYYVQYVLMAQMKSVHEYAKSKGVILKGDIPIGVNRYGCDVWTEPQYFNLNGQAGAPPDDFSVNGQNWGFPTYNWQAMLKDDCRWWVDRFRNMSNFFDAYRIDHVLGFFRIWEIPVDAVHGLLGHFSPSLGMTADEIRSYGFNFQEARYTEPFITDWVLDRVFNDKAAYIRYTYLDRIDGERYKMKDFVNTQRKVEAVYEQLKADKIKTITDETDKQKTIEALDNERDGLYALISDVLFLRDHNNPNIYHPRISVQFDFIFESLYDNDKQAFNNLYTEYFYKRNNQFWYNEAMKKLPKLVEATRMLVCAEDLGMVPNCVPWVMKELKILTLELQSMPKDPQVKFGHLSRNPYRSVCTISSHDMPTLRQWWDEDYQRTQEYYNTMLYRNDGAPHPLPGWLARDIICRHLMSPSMLCVLSIQDWFAIDEKLRLADQNAERINIPANPHHYWRYRMHLNIEDLMANKEYVDSIKILVNEAGRR